MTKQVKSRRQQRGQRQSGHPVRKRGQKVEIGYPPNLAQFCSNAEAIPPAPFLEKLLRQTIKNCRYLEGVRLEELRPYARGMTEFPRLVSLRTSQMELRRWLGPSGINLSADRGPAHRFNAHWSEDDFATVAEEFVFKLWGTAPCKIPLDVWKQALRPGMRLAFQDYLSQNPRVARKLESLIQSEEDHRSPGPLRDRVIGRLLDRTKNFFDLRAQR